ncbi:hypothetical protein [Nonomuraea diastatica]|uniref:hypothetical protein n=1 Tax=Nonomuraea diastatica TaxID=1848329 RepID=UPI0015F2B8A0|nr:hypothetical protein [Nonomuraea diastatica]
MVIRKRAPRSTQRVDVTRLPDDVVALIDALEPGESLVLTRDGESIATISSTIDVIHGSIVDRGAPDEANDQTPIDYAGVTVVATAMELSTAARVALSTQHGADYAPERALTCQVCASRMSFPVLSAPANIVLLSLPDVMGGGCAQVVQKGMFSTSRKAPMRTEVGATVLER